MIELEGKGRRRVIFQEQDSEYHAAWKALEGDRDVEFYMYISSKESDQPVWLHSFKHVFTRKYETVASPRASR